MTPPEAIAWVREQGVALESARGPVASLASAIAGETIHGSWWGHPRSREIFALTRAVRESPDVLVCRLVEDRITYVHRRLWPLLVRAANRLDTRRIARLQEAHTGAGAHVTTEIAFPKWVPDDVARSADAISDADAMHELRAFLEAPRPSKPGDDRR